MIAAALPAEPSATTGVSMLLRPAMGFLLSNAALLALMVVLAV
jgi:hypothetical protein